MRGEGETIERTLGGWRVRLLPSDHHTFRWRVFAVDTTNPAALPVNVNGLDQRDALREFGIRSGQGFSDDDYRQFGLEDAR